MIRTTYKDVWVDDLAVLHPVIKEYIDTVNLEITYAYEESEPQTFNYPGTPEAVDIIDVDVLSCSIDNKDYHIPDETADYIIAGIPITTLEEICLEAHKKWKEESELGALI